MDHDPPSLRKNGGSPLVSTSWSGPGSVRTCTKEKEGLPVAATVSWSHSAWLLSGSEGKGGSSQIPQGRAPRSPGTESQHSNKAGFRWPLRESWMWECWQEHAMPLTMGASLQGHRTRLTTRGCRAVTMGLFLCTRCQGQLFLGRLPLTGDTI